MNNSAGRCDVLLLNDDSWHEYLSDVKYRFILLDLTCSHDPCSLIDIFMLASSRMRKQGEFALRLSDVKFQQGDFSGSFLASMLDAANVYAFKLISRSSPSNMSTLCIFRYQGEETKSGHQMAHAVSYSEICRQLFSTVFEHSISEAFWNWKYPRDKIGHSVVALNADKAIAHYGLCDRGAVYNGDVFGFAQACDVMVDSRSRGAISSSVFYDLVKHGEKPFYAKDSPISLIYGFPHGRHYKLGARLKLYQPVSSIFEVVYQLGSLGTSNGLDVVNDFADSEGSIISLVDGFAEKKAIEGALLVMQGIKNTLLLTRSYSYFLQRYVYHPEFRYDVYRVKDTFFIVKKTNNQLFVMDFFGDLHDYSKMLVLLVIYLAGQFQECTLHLWCLKDITAEFIAPFSVNDTGAVFVSKTYSPDLPEFSRWWITMGDTEFL